MAGDKQTEICHNRVSMPPNKRYEQQFLTALKDIFAGAKVEGDSDYINLMKIKANSFEKGIFPLVWW